MKIKVSGNSMFPVIYESDELIISREDFYNIGDVIVFFFKCLLVNNFNDKN